MASFRVFSASTQLRFRLRSLGAREILGLLGGLGSQSHLGSHVWFLLGPSSSQEALYQEKNCYWPKQARPQHPFGPPEETLLGLARHSLLGLLPFVTHCWTPEP